MAGRFLLHFQQSGRAHKDWRNLIFDLTQGVLNGSSETQGVATRMVGVLSFRHTAIGSPWRPGWVGNGSFSRPTVPYESYITFRREYDGKRM
jgi:hypothetical protein